MEIIKWIFAPIQPLIWHPERIAAVAGVLFILYLVLRSLRRFRALPMLISAGVWAVYAPWEWYCKVKGYDIRVDLLLICPALIIVTAWGFVAGLKKQ